MAIVAGMNKASISRLKLSFKEMSTKAVKVITILTKRKAELETLMSAAGSYKNYRASIHSIEPPCVPYIGKLKINVRNILN